MGSDRVETIPAIEYMPRARMLSLDVTRCFALTLYVLLNLPGQTAQQSMAITFPNLRNLALFNRTNLLPAVRVRLHVHTSWLKLNVER